MVLQVPFDDFARACQNLVETKSVFLKRSPGGSVVTAADPAKGFLLASVTPFPVATAGDLLSQQGFEVFRGQWSAEGELDLAGPEADQAYIGAVAYRTTSHKPGLWIEAFPHEPTEVQVLRAMFDEFRGNGEVEEITFEEFLRELEVNVVVLTPGQVQRFLEGRVHKTQEA